MTENCLPPQYLDQPLLPDILCGLSLRTPRMADTGIKDAMVDKQPPRIAKASIGDDALENQHRVIIYDSDCPHKGRPQRKKRLASLDIFRGLTVQEICVCYATLFCVMRTASMCLSILQVPWCRIHIRSGSCFKLFGSYANGVEGGNSGKWTRRPITTKTEGRNKCTQSSKLSNIKHDTVDGAASTSMSFTVDQLEISESQNTQYVQDNVTANMDLAKLVTVIAFDIETTGLSRVNDRIIEIGLQDLRGGVNSTFQTLVNPERIVPNSHVHGITTHMVNKPGVPRMEELIPILLQYVESRQKHGGIVLWVAHNARCFDVPFLIKEFNRCCTEIPPNWLFMDALPLARERLKFKESNLPLSASLQSMRKFYGLPLIGSAHRVLSDVTTLSLILQRLTFDLKLSISDLLDRSFTAYDIINNKKKK